MYTIYLYYSYYMLHFHIIYNIIFLLCAYKNIIFYTKIYVELLDFFHIIDVVIIKHS